MSTATPLAYYLAAFFLLMAGIMGCTPSQSPPPDRLFVNGSHLTKVRESVAVPGSHHAEALQNIRSRVHAEDLHAYGNGVNRYNRSYLAQEAAFLGLLATAPDSQRYYAQKAFETIQDIYNSPEQERLPHKQYGLSRAMMQLGLALPYAWCRQHWDSSQLAYVSGKIDEALDAWLSYEHANFGKTRGSNWVAVCRGGELVLLLASSQQSKRKARYEFLIEQLRLHIQNGYGDLGVSQEGIGYTEYGGQFLLKAIHAAASQGDSTLFSAAQKHAWWKQAMYIGSFQPLARKFLMTGVAGPSGPAEGWASQLFGLVPNEDLPYYLWWYNRHLGQKSILPPEQRFDFMRAGTIWSVLYYPQNITEQDPTEVFPVGVADDHGYYFFRNRWRDENDIMLSLMADAHHHSNAWDQPEVFAMNLMAHNSRYVGGPSKERSDSLYSTLLVEGQYNIKNSVKLLGKPLHFEASANNAFVAVDGGELYRALGLEHAQRRMSIAFLPDNQALICISDTLVANGPKTFGWQLNLGDQQYGGHGLEVTKKGNYFRLQSEHGMVEGWLFAPGPLSFLPTEDPIRIQFSAQATTTTALLMVHNGTPLGENAAKVQSENIFSLGGKSLKVKPNGQMLLE